MRECDILMKQESYINIKEIRNIDCHRLYRNLAEFLSQILSASCFNFKDMGDSVHMQMNNIVLPNFKDDILIK